MNRNSILTAFLLIAFFALLIAAACGTARGQDFKTDIWLEDFAQLKREMSVSYANLEWAIENRGLDLKQLSAQTESRLLQARNEAEAKKNIESFLNAFGDGHLSVQWTQNEVDNSSPAGTAPAVSPLCDRLRYRSHNQPPRIAFTMLSNFREISTEDSKYFSIGVLPVANNRNIGVIRIAIFSEYAFPDLCEQVASELNLTKDAPCDDECEDRIERGAANRLTQALARQIEVLKRNKISALLVDITGNGGGTNWTEPAARTLSAKSLRSPRQQFIRHEHWTKQLKRRLGVIEADVKTPSPNRKLLVRGTEILRKAIAESEQSCDRRVIWENRKPNCSLVVSAPPLYPQSVLAFAAPGSLPDKPSSRFLFYPSRYAYREGVYSGQLIILADQGTWSSAEYFAAMLRDNNAATVIGQPTGGAGCGYTNGGIATLLKNSRAIVKIPDCVRLRADGTNEVAGITPDVSIAWRSNDNRYQRAKRVSEALSVHINRTAKPKVRKLLYEKK